MPSNRAQVTAAKTEAQAVELAEMVDKPVVVMVDQPVVEMVDQLVEITVVQLAAEITEVQLAAEITVVQLAAEGKQQTTTSPLNTTATLQDIKETT